MNIAKRVVHVAYGTTADQTSSFEYEAAAYVYSRIVLYGLKNRLLNQFPRVRFRKERAEVSGRRFRSSFVGRCLSHLDEKPATERSEFQSGARLKTMWTRRGIYS